ncbi:hypothetical protein G8E10_24825 [Rhizobiaceae bacterium CRRU44]|uniref:Uncharacterized protein n=2 Tax=Ferranicluibacter rubi TaxID=2715133 RepID=A0AA43ZJD5_9HYPH|nr:hypothetical protein [Ferranicluibacter rubi]
MKKTAISITAAMFAMTALSSPARADGDLLRLGIGIGATILGEAMKGGKDRQPRRGDKLEGRVGDRQQTRERQTRNTKGREAAPATAAAVATLALPEVIPTPEAKPTAEEMAVWLADAPNREQAEIEIAADAEMRGVQPALDQTTTAATTTEAATVELVDNDGKSWGKVSAEQHAKAMKFASLGMTLADAYRAIGLKGPITATTTAEAEGIDLIDEQGRLWGNVPDAVADKVWKAVDLGMKPSEAFAVLSGLKNPDDKAKETAKAETAKIEEEAKTLALCLEPLRMAVAYTECRPYKGQQEAKRTQEKAERQAKLDKDRADAEAAARMTAEAYAKKQRDEAEAKAFADLLSGNGANKPAPIVEAKKPEAVAEIPPVVVVDQTAKTAAVEPTAEAKPAEKTKPKLDIDL